ncbi:MAG: hypothetical protein C7B46_14800 [Sulfobacillus benefaciens]|uniref:Uncharacterized protein n=1 Tax=Sulfobacillus benefaciens TaxID=453960 RepID=A0A2T2XCW4_9FIRM|nr:MAG: hypothetical protein C7B46_14800 [Sulfobacillus benefaciens]
MPLHHFEQGDQLMASEISHYLAEAITPWGIRDFYPDLLSRAETVIVLTHSSPHLVSAVLQQYVATAVLPHRAQVFHSALDPECLVAVLVDQRICITSQRIISGDIRTMARNMLTIPVEEDPGSELPPFPNRVPALLGMAKAVRDEISERVRQSLDADKIAQARNRLSSYLTNSGSEDGIASHYFGSSLSACGWAMFLSDAFHGILRRIRFEGPLGMDHTSLIRWFAERAMLQGFDVQLFHCEWDPSQIDHVVIPSLSIGLTLATAPHAINSSPSDEIIDMSSWQKEPPNQDLWDLYSSYRTALSCAQEWLSGNGDAKKFSKTLVASALRALNTTAATLLAS